MSRENVFVYGTLRRREYNHHWMESANGTFVGEDALLAKRVENFGLPAIIAEPKEEIHGELFSVPEDKMWRLDLLEGHPNFYRREKVPLQSGTEAWVYFLNR